MAQAASSAPAQQPPYLGAESIEYGVGKSGVRPRWEYDGHPLWRKDYVWDRPFSSIPLYQPRPQDLIPEKPPRRRWPTRKIFSVAALASMAVKPDPKPEPPPPPPAQLSEFLVVDPPAEEAEPAAPSPAAAVQRVRSAPRRPSAVTRPSLTPTLEPEWSTRGSTVIVVEPEPEPVEEPPEPEPPPRARRRAKRAKKPKEGKPKPKPAPAPRPPPPPPPEPPKLTLLPPPPPPPPKKPEPPPPKKKKVAVVSPPQVAAAAAAATPVVVPEPAPEPVVVVPTPPPVEAKAVEEPPVLPPAAEANATPEPPPPAPPAPPAEPPPPPPADPPPPPAPEEREEEEGDVVDFFSVQDGEDLLELPASPGPLSPADQKMSFRAPKGPRTVSLESPRDFKPRQRTADAKDPVELALTLKGAAQMVDDFFRDMKGFEKRRKANYASCNVLSEDALEQRRNTPPLRTHRDLLAGMAGEAKVHTAGAARVFAEAAAAAAAAAAVASPPSGRPSPRSPLSPSASGEFERRSVSRRQGSPQSSHGSPYGGQRSLGADTVLTSRSDFGDRTLLETSASAAPLSPMSGTARGDSEFSPQSPHSSAPPRTAPTGLSSSQSGCPPIHTLGGRSLVASAPGAESLAHHPGAQLYLLGPNQHVPPSSPGVLSPLLPQHWPPGAVPRPPDGSRSVTGQIVETLKAMQLSETQRLKREAYAAMRGAYLAEKRRGAAGACALEPKGCVRLLPDALGPPSSPIVASPTATTSSGPGSSLTVPAAGWLPSVSTPASRPSRSAQPGKRSAPPSPPFAM